MNYHCLLIGHNEMIFEKYEASVRKMGEQSEVYQNLLFDFIKIDGVPHTLPEVLNKSVCKDEELSLGETFSATIAYLVTYGARRGVNIDYIRDFQKQKDDIIERLKSNNYLTIGISTTLYVSYWPIKEIVEFVRTYHKNIKIIVGGPFVFNTLKKYNKSEVEYLFLHIGADVYINSMQGEKALIETIRTIEQNEALAGVDNIVYKEHRKIYFNNTCEERNQLCENMVDWSLFGTDVGKYATLRTSISCAFRCKFCTFPKHAGKYQAVGTDKIEYELDTLKKIGTVERIHFIDDTFNIPYDRFKELLKLMIKKQYGFKWHSYARCQYLDEETVQLMKQSGVEGVFLGIESGSQKILDAMNKRVTVEDYKRGIALLKKYGIITFASYIIGFPGETYSTAKETIEFIREVKTDFWRAQLWYGETLSDIYNEKEKYNIEGSQFNWSHATLNSKLANELLIDMFCKINESVWIPQYNFDFENIFHLMGRNLNLEEIKALLSDFKKKAECNFA